MMPHPRRLHKEERKTRDGAKLPKETQTKENADNFKKADSFWLRPADSVGLTEDGRFKGKAVSVRIP